MGHICCTETSTINYHVTLHNVPEERRYHFLRGGSLKSRIFWTGWLENSGARNFVQKVSTLSQIFSASVFFPLSDWLRAGRFGFKSRWERDFPPVQTGPVAHPDSCKMGTGSFPGVKCSRGVLLTTRPLLVPRSWKGRAITLPTLWTKPDLWREHFNFLYFTFICMCVCI